LWVIGIRKSFVIELSFGAFEALKAKMSGIARICVWPSEKREKDDVGNCGCLHVKCVVADDRAAFVSSANLTGLALNLNMELGLLIRGGDVPLNTASHLRQLMQAGILVMI
jgi:hypothetical protein